MKITLKHKKPRYLKKGMVFMDKDTFCQREHYITIKHGEILLAIKLEVGNRYNQAFTSVPPFFMYAGKRKIVVNRYETHPEKVVERLQQGSWYIRGDELLWAIKVDEGPLQLVQISDMRTVNMVQYVNVKECKYLLTPITVSEIELI